MFRGSVREIKEFKDTRYFSRIKFSKETAALVRDTQVRLTPADDIQLDEVAPKPNITFIAGGTAYTAYKLAKNQEMHIAALNFADAIIPGGCVEYGAPTQEENLCRCTNLYESLTDAVEYYYWNSLAKNRVYTDAVIYSPNVVCFKDDITYAKLRPRQFDIITCPSPAKRVKNDVLEHRIEGIIKIAVVNRVNTIILGAWGCGAFQQDPYNMGQQFAKVLNKYNYFDNVVFAIRPSSAGWAEENKTVFEEGFESVYEG